VIENQNKGETWKPKKVLHISPSKIWFRNGIHSLSRRANARGDLGVCDAYRYFVGQVRYKVGHAQNI